MNAARNRRSASLEVPEFISDRSKTVFWNTLLPTVGVLFLSAIVLFSVSIAVLSYSVSSGDIIGVASIASFFLLVCLLRQLSFSVADCWTQLERWGRQGRSVLHLTEPARVSGPLQGQVDTGIPPEDADGGPFDVELCRYQWQFHFKKNDKKAKNLGEQWSENATVQGHVPDGKETVHVSISFALPADQPPTPSPKPPAPKKGSLFVSGEEPTFPNWELHVERASSDSASELMLMSFPHEKNEENEEPSSPYEATFRVPVEEAPSSDEVQTEEDFWAAVEEETDASKA